MNYPMDVAKISVILIEFSIVKAQSRCEIAFGGIFVVLPNKHKVVFSRKTLVGCFGFNGPLRQYFSLYRAVSQRAGERKEK